jgi:hypothetical protein
MGLETATYLADLVASNPLGTDDKSKGDDHIRLVKAVLQATFPYLAGGALRVQAKSSGYTVLTTDNYSIIRCTAALTLALTAAASLGNPHAFVAYADGGAVIIDPNGAETINGAATLTIPDGIAALVMCNGSAFFAIHLFESSDLTAQISAATEILAGKAEIATQAETDAGADDLRFITALKLKSWTPGVDTVTLAGDDKILLADTSDAGKLKQALASDVDLLHPKFRAACGTAASLTASTYVKIPFATETYDVGGYYDNAVNYRYTPLIAGYYQVNLTARVLNMTKGNEFRLALYKNGVLIEEVMVLHTGAGADADFSLNISTSVQLNGSTDYIEAFARCDDTSPATLKGDATANIFSAYRI